MGLHRTQFASPLITDRQMQKGNGETQVRTEVFLSAQPIDCVVLSCHSTLQACRELGGSFGCTVGLTKTRKILRECATTTTPRRPCLRSGCDCWQIIRLFPPITSCKLGRVLHITSKCLFRGSSRQKRYHGWPWELRLPGFDLGSHLYFQTAENWSRTC